MKGQGTESPRGQALAPGHTAGESPVSISHFIEGNTEAQRGGKALPRIWPLEGTESGKRDPEVGKGSIKDRQWPLRSLAREGGRQPGDGSVLEAQDVRSSRGTGDSWRGDR